MDAVVRSRSTAKRTAFVLAGGGSLGAVQVGMLKALTRQGVAADLLVGASAGAINAAAFGADPSLAGLSRLENIWRRLQRRDVFPFSPIDSLLSLLGKRDHFVSPSGLGALIDDEYPGYRLEHSQVPCHVICSDALTGAEVVLSSGPATTTLLASSAIPSIFPAVEIEGRFLMDGGVANNTPISTAIGLGATRVIVLSTGMSCSLDRLPRGAFAIALHALNLLIMRQLSQEMAHLEADIELIVVPPLCPLTITPYDFSQSGELIHRADLSTGQWLEQGRLRVSEPAVTRIPHAHQAARCTAHPWI